MGLSGAFKRCAGKARDHRNAASLEELRAYPQYRVHTRPGVLPCVSVARLLPARSNSPPCWEALLSAAAENIRGKIPGALASV
jgi:hypothetical protein